MNGTDIMQRFRHVARGAAHRAAVRQLRRKHILLYAAREPEKQRQKRRQHERQPAVCKPDNRQNADDLARIGKHADDTACKERLHRVHIAHKPGNERAGLLVVEAFRAQARKFCHQPAAQRVRNLLPEHGQPALAQRFHHARQRDQREICRRGREADPLARRQRVDNPPQNQRRKHRRGDRPADGQHDAQREPFLFLHGFPDNTRDALLIFLHFARPLPARGKAPRIRDSPASVLRACPSAFFPRSSRSPDPARGKDTACAK